MTKSTGLMKLTKKLESEIRKAYLTYWESYFTGDLKTFSSIIDDSYTMIGTSEGEVINGKKETTRWLKASVKEIKGKAEFRSRKIKISLIEQLAFVHEQANAFILANNKWQFYSKIRISTFLSKSKGNWKVVQQHGSLPDGRTEEGETVSFESLTQENLQLRDAVKRRTTELELQNQELEIQTSLERVRAVAMSMHKPEDLATICKVLYHELRDLGFEEMRNTQINIHDNDNKKLLNYDYIPERGSNVTHFNYTSHPLIKNLVKQLQKGNDFSSFTIGPNRLKEWRALRKKSGEKEDAQLKKATSLHYYFYSIGNGAIGLSAIKKLSTTKLDLLKRFRNVFDLAYRRYEDIKKAEAQAREAEIELALERVRASTMAMQNSAELRDAGNMVFHQMKELGIEAETSWLWFIDSKKDTIEIWTTHENKLAEPVKVKGSDLWTFKKEIDAWKNKESYLSLSIPKKEAIQSVRKVFGVKIRSNRLSTYFHLLQTRHQFGFLGLGTWTEATENEKRICSRFAKVFEQAYTRFLDLQKAEAQAREAQIEAALEKVRSRSLGMHKSEEIKDVVVTVMEKINELNIEMNGGVSLATFTEDSKDLLHWYVNPGHVEGAITMRLPYFDNILFRDFEKARKSGQELLPLVYSFEEKNEYFHYTFEHSDFKVIPQELKKWILEQPCFGYSVAIQKHSAIFFNDYTGKLFSESENEVLLRFAKVFDQAYVRFLDLQKAEAQAREAKIEMALEKIRARTMAMQHSDELPESANLLFMEVQALGIPAWSAGYNILAADQKSSTCIMSSEGTLQQPFHLPLTGEASFNEWFDLIQSKETFLVQELGGKELQQHYDYMKSLPELKPIFQHIQDSGLTLPTYQINHLAKFTHGFLLFITYEKVPEVHDLFKRLTNVFDQTYTRFLDLQKAEAQALKAKEDLIEIKKARKKAEEALSNLQEAQKQLIQSEKMASLGELTAGIAHEIQNPLNFVNNFSEVSSELVDEMNNEIDQGNSEEAKEIAADLKQNLQKINHHGKRAGDIVKGMLQHSRTSSGQKEPTDVNALCDEYLRLAFHGMRAKDKSFNAKFETDFESSLQKVNVVPQDIGRVILNLITNAFYVVNEKSSYAKASEDKRYEPTVWVSTKIGGDKVLISVKDNGSGMSETVKEKIFQPFFTTKPTGQGTGLGLSLSYDIVKAHGGELKVETVEGEGSEFIIHLPVV